MQAHLEQALEASKQAEAELRGREERLRISLEAANVGTWDWNVRTGEVRWSENLERIHGHTPGTFRGTFEGFLDGVHPDDRQLVLGAIQHALVSGNTYEIEYRSLLPDGTVKWFEGRGHVIRNPAGEASWMSGICMDTTERHQLQEQLRQTQRLESLGLLAGGIAHDFNNLLTGIIGNSSLAIANLPASDPANPLLRNVLSASQRAAQLTQQLLAYAGKSRVVSESIDLGEVVKELVPLLRPAIPSGVRLQLDVARSQIQADASQIHQLVMNLIINAAESITGAGLIILTTGVEDVAAGSSSQLTPGRYAFLRVSDTGCGMDEATVSRIFDPFFSTKLSGRGLGLAAAQGTVRAHHGAMTVESTPGRGTTFTVLLPASDNQPDTAPQNIAEADPSGSGTILVVDDEEVVLRMAQAALAAYGYRTLLAIDGRSALEALTASDKEIRGIVLDLTMPGMPIGEVLANLRARLPAAPIVITSGYCEPETLEQLRDLGISAFLQKPYTAEQLARSIGTILARSWPETTPGR
jgi:PAS domain S-box-containing protein